MIFPNEIGDAVIVEDKNKNEMEQYFNRIKEVFEKYSSKSKKSKGITNVNQEDAILGDKNGYKCIIISKKFTRS